MSIKTGKYYLQKKETAIPKYDEVFEKCVVDTCRYCIENTEEPEDNKLINPIMMLGKIQSGKTRAFTAVIALAFDNEFDMILILTKNSTALVKQTVSRMKKEFKIFINDNDVEVKDIIKMKYALTGYELEKKLIIIAKKEEKNLTKIIDFIKTYSIGQNKKCLIIDDEADATSIGFGKNKKTGEFDLRTVANKVNDIRGALTSCIFIQVTATPYALYLQPDFGHADKSKPIRPHKTILVPSGDGYIGGQYYFIDSRSESHPAHFLFEAVDSDEHAIVSDQRNNGKKSKLSDKRIFKAENIFVEEKALPIFKRGVFNFAVGAIVLRILGDKQNYGYVIHTATQKILHAEVKKVVDEMFKQIKDRTAYKHVIPAIEKILEVSYDDIKKSVEAYGYIMPQKDIVKAEFYAVIDKGYYSVDAVNSETDVEDLLDEDSGELRLRTPLSIFVGGQVLDRGITIPRMIGFYYGRNPNTMQQDTVLQHSRMFGYRTKELLSVTRFYTTDRIRSNMEKITDIDIELRKDIEAGSQGNGVYFMEYKKEDSKHGGNGRIIPCSPDKIKNSDVIMIKPHKRFLPVGFMSHGTVACGKASVSIDKALGISVTEDALSPKMIPVDTVKELILHAYNTLKPDDDLSRFVPVDEFLGLLTFMLEGKTELPVVVKKGKNNSKIRISGRLEDAPETGDMEGRIAQRAAASTPVLLLLQETGNASGWNAKPFWWPVLVSPGNIPRMIYASKSPIVTISKN